jgi:phage shock protein E
MKPAHHRLSLLSLVFCVSIAACLHVTVPDAPRETPAANYTDPDALLALLSKPVQPYVLVDVRTQDEYTGGHIPTAVNLPYDVIATNPPTTDTSALIIVYCASGRRSALAASALRQLGYTRVVDFGSISRWKWTLIDSNQPGECPCKSL